MNELSGGKAFYGEAIGILMLDMQAPLIPGNVGNATSYGFPVRYKKLDTLPSDWWCDALDCEDTDPNAHPGAEELPDNGVDDDCDGLTDEVISCDFGDPCGPYQDCCEQSEECVNDWQCLPICSNERCGENLADCCAAAEICLDGLDCVLFVKRVNDAAQRMVGGEEYGVEIDVPASGGELSVADEALHRDG